MALKSAFARQTVLLSAMLACSGGCQALKPPSTPTNTLTIETQLPPVSVTSSAEVPAAIRQVTNRQEAMPPEPMPAPDGAEAEPLPLAGSPALETLADLEDWALGNNATLHRVRHEAAAEWAKVDYVNKLPDPTVSAMFFAPPMNFAPDRQVAEMQVMQMLPWLDRLHAEARQAHLEALAAETEYQAELLRVVGDIRVAWFQLYVLNKQIEITEADKTQLESLVNTANARIRTGDAQPGDVLMAALQLSRLQEQLLGYRQQVAATTAELNRLVGRDVRTPVAIPASIDVEVPDWNHDLLREIALNQQPEVNSARLRTAATRWGVEVARLKRRPDLTFGVGWVAMDAPGAVMPGAGRDSFTIGFSATLPIWRRKYDAVATEAYHQHDAAHATEDEIVQRLDALLHGLWEQALASRQTIELYQNSILPQARQTFAADQQSLANGTVTFDRVIQDYRTLLSLELGYHQALGQLAITLARIRQTAGADLLTSAEPPSRP